MLGHCRSGSAVLTYTQAKLIVAAVTAHPKEACYVFHGLRGFQKHIGYVLYTGLGRMLKVRNKLLSR